MQNQPVLMQIEDYIKAGKIAGEVRENVRQEELEKKQTAISYYNRSGNKDSQLK